MPVVFYDITQNGHVELTQEVYDQQEKARMGLIKQRDIARYILTANVVSDREFLAAVFQLVARDKEEKERARQP